MVCNFDQIWSLPLTTVRRTNWVEGHYYIFTFSLFIIFNWFFSFLFLNIHLLQSKILKASSKLNVWCELRFFFFERESLMNDNAPYNSYIPTDCQSDNPTTQYSQRSKYNTILIQYKYKYIYKSESSKMDTNI